VTSTNSSITIEQTSIVDDPALERECFITRVTDTAIDCELYRLSGLMATFIGGQASSGNANFATTDDCPVPLENGACPVSALSFSYSEVRNEPRIDSVRLDSRLPSTTPRSTQGGTPMEIIGSNFGEQIGDVEVRWYRPDQAPGERPEHVSLLTKGLIDQANWTDSRIGFLSPPGYGTVTVVVSIVGTFPPKTASSTFSYTNPQITSVENNFGPTSGYLPSHVANTLSSDSTITDDVNVYSRPEPDDEAICSGEGSTSSVLPCWRDTALPAGGELIINGRNFGPAPYASGFGDTLITRLESSEPTTEIVGKTGSRSVPYPWPDRTIWESLENSTLSS